MADIIRIVLLYQHVIIGCVAATMLLAVVYLLVASPVFTSSVKILIETNRPKVFPIVTPDGLATLDAPQVESQIALIKSEQIASKVVSRLGSNDAATRAQSSWSGRLAASLRRALSFSWDAMPGLTQPQAEAMQRHNAAMEIMSNLDVRREGLSYVLSISYSARDPIAAADIAAAIAHAYLEDQTETWAKAVGQGSAWLEERIEDLRTKMNAATLSVQQFKVKRDYSIPISDRIPQGKASSDGGAGAAREVQATLSELESRAETYRKIFESYLQAYAESMQRQSYPSNSARVISPATIPMARSKPLPKFVFLGALASGLLLGLGLALTFSSLEKQVRLPRWIRGVEPA